MAGSDEGGRAGRTILAVGEAALNLGTNVARSIAEGLSGQPQPPRAGETRIGEIARHGTSALGSLVVMTIAAAREAGIGLGGASSPAQPPQSGAAGLPRVMPGASLRVPLSIDNPGSQTMLGLTPYLLNATHDGQECAAPFTLGFEPATLSIAPRDFEKLVVTITLPADMPEGQWAAVFALGPGAPDPNVIAFSVSSPES